jgi:putative addiction module killer protein
MQLVTYETEDGRIPFQKWFDGLDAVAATKVYVSLARLEAGNTSNLKSVGEGVLEQRIDFGPGYRVYLGRDGDTLIILLAGGTKQRQQRDIDDAITRWHDYKTRKKRI